MTNRGESRALAPGKPHQLSVLAPRDRIAPELAPLLENALATMREHVYFDDGAPETSIILTVF